ncbi:MAG: glycosyltransferase [Syntrophales bacterium]|nr:glycosyltransferase [Syntrophales bacterium]
MPKVSIIVPVFNMEKYLAKCLDSLTSQTLADIEIVAVNDESTDASPEIITAYAEKDRRIRVVHRNNGGLSMARNSGLDVATGEYVGFVDSDDWVEREMFERMYEAGHRDSADVVICNYNRIFENAVERSRLGIETETVDVAALGIRRYFDKYQFTYRHGDEAWNKIYRREFLEGFGIRFERNREIFSEDKLFNLYCLLHVKKISTLDSSFYNYLQRQGSIMYRRKPDYTKRQMTLMERFYRRAQSCDRDGDMEDIFHELVLMMIENIVFDKFGTEGLGLREVCDDLRNANDFSFFKPSMRALLLRAGSMKKRLYSLLLYHDLFIPFLLLKIVFIRARGMKRKNHEAFC